MNTPTTATRAEYDARYRQYMDRIARLLERKKELDTLYMQHANDQSAPHGVTSAALRLGALVNAPRMTETEAQNESGSIIQKYSTPLRVRQTIDRQFTPLLTEHVGNKDNPHGLTAAALRSMTADQIIALADLYYNKGEAVDRTTRLGGSTIAQIRNSARSGLNASEIKSGLLKYSNISSSSRPAKSVIKMGPNNTLTWGPFNGGQGNATVYRYATGPSYGILSNTIGAVAAWMNSTYPATTLVEGSLGAVAVQSSGENTASYGNGHNINRWNWKNIVILQVRNRRWVG